MTPAARYAAAIEVLDEINDGAAAEAALLAWARRSRFAGSKDRAAVRDHVFDVLRRRSSSAVLGGGVSGRCLIIGLLRGQGIPPETVFTGEGHAPVPLSADEAAGGDAPSGAAALDWPEWLWSHINAAWGDEASDVAYIQRDRAEVFLRVNEARSSISEAQETLVAEGIETETVSTAPFALRVMTNPRRVAQSEAYKTGLVELQDTSSQIAIDWLDLAQGETVLDYCAGGGGKALAMAAKGARVAAHDISAARMTDIADRAARAGVAIKCFAPNDVTGSFHTVYCDAPCSGSGTWRRTPDAKWRFTPERLVELTGIQHEILQNAVQFVAEGGRLVYSTCSVLADENEQTVESFLKTHPDWTLERRIRLKPDAVQDGFFSAVLRKH